MSTTPQGWQNPRTNWQAADIVHPNDFNRIEGNIQAVELGSRTVDQSLAPSGNSGTLRQFLSWFANRIKAILGTTNWWDAPPTTLAATKQHMGAGGAAHAVVTTEEAGFMSAEDKATLDSLAAGGGDYAQAVATVNNKRAGYAVYAP